MDMWPVLPGPVVQPPGGKDSDGPCAPRLASGRGGESLPSKKGEKCAYRRKQAFFGAKTEFPSSGPGSFSYELLCGFKPASGSEPSHPGIKIMFPANELSATRGAKGSSGLLPAALRLSSRFEQKNMAALYKKHVTHSLGTPGTHPFLLFEGGNRKKILSLRGKEIGGATH